MKGNGCDEECSSGWCDLSYMMLNPCAFDMQDSHANKVNELVVAFAVYEVNTMEWPWGCLGVVHAILTLIMVYYVL